MTGLEDIHTAVFAGPHFCFASELIPVPGEPILAMYNGYLVWKYNHSMTINQ